MSGCGRDRSGRGPRLQQLICAGGGYAGMDLIKPIHGYIQYLPFFSLISFINFLIFINKEVKLYNFNLRITFYCRI